MSTTIDTLNKITIQFASDLHLEFYKSRKDFPLLKPSANYLVLAGDIGYPFHPNYKEYLELCSPNYKKIFIISGNHEYYQLGGEKKTMAEIDNKIKEITLSLSNVEFLHNSSSTIEDDIVILGTTLWTDIPFEKTFQLSFGMNDYRTIFTGNPPTQVTPSITSSLHKKNVEWLTSEIEKNKDKRIVVTTHHLPSLKFINEMYLNHPLNSGFATSIDSLIKSPVCAWIAGHTHSCKSFVYNNVQCEVNSKGYPYEKTGFRDNAVITV
jgi:predicted phosphodiesterase